MKRLYVAMYHYTRDLSKSRYPRIKALDLPLFREQIEYMSSHFNIVTMEQVMAATEGKCDLPDNALLLTFDDGYADNYTFALPILEEFGVQGSFFIPVKTFTAHKLLNVNRVHYILACADSSRLLKDVLERMDYYRGSEFDYPSTQELWNKYATASRFDGKDIVFIKRMLQTVLPEELQIKIAEELFEKYVGISEEHLAYELYLTEDQIKSMKRRGMHIGIHGYDHYWLANLPTQKMKEDIAQSLEALDGIIDRRQWAIAYPYGNYNDEVLKYIKKQGACIGFTTEVEIADLGKHNALTLPRLDCNDFPPKSENYKKM